MSKNQNYELSYNSLSTEYKRMNYSSLESPYRDELNDGKIMSLPSMYWEIAHARHFLKISVRNGSNDDRDKFLPSFNSSR